MICPDWEGFIASGSLVYSSNLPLVQQYAQWVSGGQSCARLSCGIGTGSQLPVYGWRRGSRYFDSAIGNTIGNIRYSAVFDSQSLASVRFFTATNNQGDSR